MQSQREAVYNAVINVVGQLDGKYELSKNQRDEVVMIVSQGIEEGNVVFSDSARTKYHSSALVKTYTVGLVSNWLRKDTRLNGGVKYQPKNPGSRTGQTDPQLKALRALLKQQTDSTMISKIESHIESRKAEIQAEKLKSVEIDYSQIPAELKAQLGIEE